ncbi:zinc finger BED domain-containing protein RICESLEEPER 1-like [Rosa rugosa]|uniref:zinc finger BED domain-containing protein RICESLEEPER 1-like n=1 Tax=Rosa rugosa TaxID=74645 RepID=UPI002B40A500|nr:zinc finger BED domain-containing protein RICESLEEPER 1-like [Rosa rugosa]
MEDMSYSCANNEIMDEDVEQSVPRKRKRKAAVWDNFEVKVIKGEEKAICKHCGKILSAKSSNGTNSLNLHVKSCKGLKPQSTRSEGTVIFGYFDESNAKTELANMIILHEYQLSMVEHLGFRRYSNALQPSFRVPCRNTIKKEIMKIYEFEKEKTMKLIHMNRSRIAITTDMWTASNQKKGFMAITSHFIDDSWNLQSRLLRYI